jgi:YHS domain-containing protein
MHVRVLTAAMAAFASLVVLAGCEKKPAAQTPTPNTVTTAKADNTQEDPNTVQTTCPVMEGNPINKALFVEYKGKKVYFCCKGCEERFLAEPEKYVAKLPQFKQP